MGNNIITPPKKLKTTILICLLLSLFIFVLIMADNISSNKCNTPSLISSTVNKKELITDNSDTYQNSLKTFFPAGIYLFKINNGNTKTMPEICSKLTIKTPERRQ